MAILKNICWFCFVCLTVEVVKARRLQLPKDDELPKSPYPSLASPKPTDKKFFPLVMSFPDTERSSAEAKEYKEEKLKAVSSHGKKDDKHFKMTGASCARGLGDLYKAVDDNDNEVYEVCFDDDRASAIYSTHIVDLADKTLEHSKHKSFKSVYTLSDEKLNEKYNAIKQADKFLEQFGKDVKISDRDTRKSNFFSRNHLTPHADFAKASDQALTYYFQNSVPGKQSMNQSNWSKLERLVREMSIQMHKALRVFTGVYGILMKYNKKGEFVEVYLDQPLNGVKKHVEVPLVIWKLVIDEETNDSVAFFTSNDTDMDEKQVKVFQSLCKSVCTDLGFNFKEEPKYGITLCCKYADFEKHIRDLPIELGDSNLLINPYQVEKYSSKLSKTKPADAA